MKGRRRWFALHSWTGLNLSLLMSFVLITGTLATVSKELDWLANPASRVYRIASHTEPDWARLYENASLAFPDATIVSLAAPTDPWLAAEAIALDCTGERFRIFLDPASSAVQGTGRWHNWQRFFRQTHRHLMLPIKVGVTIVGLLCVPLFVSFVTGTVVYRKWWKGFASYPARQPATTPKGAAAIKRSRRFWGDMHRLLGVWSLWFILLMALTGAWYLVEQWGLQHTYPPLRNAASQQAPETAIRAPENAVRGPALAEIMATAADLYPELRVSSVFLPAEGSGAVRLQGTSGAILVRQRANQMAFDAASGEHLETRRAGELGLHGRISEAADPLHFGTFANAASRFIWFVFGLIMSALALSGVYLYGLRAAKSLRDNRAGAQRIWSLGWRGMRYAKWPSTLLLAICLFLAMLLFL